jgi:hypothetical protein
MVQHKPSTPHAVRINVRIALVYIFFELVQQKGHVQVKKKIARKNEKREKKGGRGGKELRHPSLGR